MVFKKKKKSEEEIAEISDEEEDEEEEIEVKKPRDPKPKAKPKVRKEMIIVNELPVQPISNLIDDNTGTEIEYITRDEALKEILEILRNINEED